MPLDCQIEIGEWCSLQPVWKGDENIVRAGMSHAQLSPAWQVMLLGDGSLTRHLQLVVGEPIGVDVIDMSEIGLQDDNAPADVSAIVGPRVRRQVWLRSRSGQRLAYAASWWAKSEVDFYLRNRSLPIWMSLKKFQAELYRDIKGIYYGSCQTLEEDWGESGPLWGRHYLMWYDRKPLTLIYEVFSPALRQYIGDS